MAESTAVAAADPAPNVSVPTLSLDSIMGATSEAAALVKILSAAGDEGTKTALKEATRQGLGKQVQSMAVKAQQSDQASADAQSRSAVEQAILTQLGNTKTREIQIAQHEAANSSINAQEIARLNSEIASKDKALDSTLADLTKRQQNGFFDNPAQWLYDQFALPVDKEAYNMQVQDRNNTENRVNSAISRGSEAAKFIRDTADTGSAEILIAQNNKAIADAQVTIAAAQKVAGANSVAYSQMMFEAASKNETLNLAQANYALDKKYKEASLISMEQRQAIDKYTIENIEANKAALKVWNNLMGDQQSQLSWDSAPPNVKLARIGVATQNSIGGYTPYTAFRNMKITGAPIPNPATRALYTEMQSSYAQLESSVSSLTASDGKIKFSTPEAQQAEVERQFNQHWSSKNKQQVSESAPGYGVPFIGVIKSAPEIVGTLKNNSLWNSIVSKMPDETRITNQSLIMHTVVAVQNKELSPQQASAQLGQIISAYMLINNKMVNQTVLGAPVQSTFWVHTSELPGLALTGREGTINLADTADRTNYLIRQTNPGLRSLGGVSSGYFNTVNPRPDTNPTFFKPLGAK